ncbi:MAG: transporter substrate-binding domain-containing protein [Thermoflexaceae bacterium]|nr:transporter substrate-binding domain-containing protein [Thermoflexaceae bacterium]
MKKQWKKIGMFVTAATVTITMLTGCARNNGNEAFEMEHGQSDLEYVQSKGTLVVGITDFAPMDYRDGEEWTGFDAKLAEAFAESIGVTAELVEIDWDKKTELLEKGTIDCIWNGMTMTEELQEIISCSEPYLSNAQVVVLRSSEMEQYNTEEACQHLLFAVEAGSTGESLLKEKKYRYTAYSTQMEALESVREKKADATVIDIIMAAYYTGDGQEFDDLGFDISLNDEKICIGFRKDSDLTEKVNEFLKASYEDGTISSLAERYGIVNAVLK